MADEQYSLVIQDYGSVPFYGYINDSAAFLLRGYSGQILYYRRGDLLFRSNSLRYVRETKLIDQFGNVVDRGWMYAVEGDTLNVVFSDTSFTSDDDGEPLYRLYFSENGQQFQRWLTESGTRRYDLFATVPEAQPRICTEFVPTGFEGATLGPNQFGLAAIKQIWNDRKELKVRFLSGSAGVKAKIEEQAHRWSEHANIVFKFGNYNDAEIRISVDDTGRSNSYVGKSTITDPTKPTMNFGWLTNDTPKTEYSRTVLHEFGHALGLIHEHQNPKGDIPWDKPAVYDYYKKKEGWTKGEVDANIFTKYDKTQLNGFEYDSRSIMHYAVPNELTIGDYEVGWNNDLSELDKKYIAVLYPFGANPDPIEDRLKKFLKEVAEKLAHILDGLFP